jgi:hypothetical protein
VPARSCEVSGEGKRAAKWRGLTRLG